jgi:hypothetical protein
MIRSLGPLASILALLVLNATACFAAKEVGNGGDAILCPATTRFLPARLYDHYEAEVKYNRQLDLGGPLLTVDTAI